MRSKPFKYSDEHIEFLKSFIPGHSHVEILTTFREKFNVDYTECQLRNFMRKYNVKTGFTGHFYSEGGAKAFKFKKGEYPKGCEKTWFKNGHSPENKLPVGTVTERKNRNGKTRIFVKIAEPNKWVLYPRYNWEQHYGKIPEGYVVTYLDGNYRNCDIDNLTLIRKDDLPFANYYLDVDKSLRPTVLATAELNGVVRRSRSEEHD